MTTPLFSRLRSEIATYHRQAEEIGPFRSILAGTISLEQYRAMLMRLHGFLAVAEPAAARALATAAPALDTAPLARLPDLRRDLAWLGLDEREIALLPQAEPVGTISGVAGAFAWYYLSEGSRKGGRMLAGLVSEQLGLGPGAGIDYFASRDQPVDTRWPWFVELTMAHCATGRDRELLVASACRCFFRLNSWLAGNTR